MPSPHTSISRGQSSSLSNDSGGIEEIEFRIYPDGRVTEIVKGVKGNNCQEVTACKSMYIAVVYYISAFISCIIFSHKICTKIYLEQPTLYIIIIII